MILKLNLDRERNRINNNFKVNLSNKTLLDAFNSHVTNNSSCGAVPLRCNKNAGVDMVDYLMVDTFGKIGFFKVVKATKNKIVLDVTLFEGGNYYI